VDIGKNATTLEEAQEHKLRLTCEKMGFKTRNARTRHRVWLGKFCYFCCKRIWSFSGGGYYFQRTNRTSTKSVLGIYQWNFVFSTTAIVPKEYGRDFDRIVSIGMFEHVGSKNYPQFFSVVDSVLKDNGLFLYIQ